MNYIGIDVDSVLLVCRKQYGDKRYAIKQFKNTSAGHRQFMKWATQRGRPARVCMEATGVYSLPLALALHATEGIEVMVKNPKAIKKFADARLQRGKTDAMDADTILEYLLRMPFKAWQPASEEVLEIQHITRRIVQLNSELTRERNRHKAARRLGTIGRVVANDTAVNMRHIQRRIDTIEAEAINLVESVPELHELFRLLVSINGIAKKTAVRILAELASLPADMLAKQWVAYAGLDPRPYESGTSTNKPRRVTKAGNRYLREALFFPALVASQKDKHVSAYYKKMLNNGKKPMQAIVAIMRKLLLAIWGMFKNKCAWEGNKFYKIA